MPYGAVLFLGWIVHWLAFFPGEIEHDALDQWSQIVRGQYINWHPTFHTWYLWLLSRIGDSFGTVGLVQIVVAAVLGGRLMAEVRRLHGSVWATWGATGWLCVSPVFAFNLIAPWKDTAFALTLVWMTLVVVRMATRLDVPAHCGMKLGLAMAMASLFRHNGVLTVVPVASWAVWRLRGRSRTALYGAAVVFLGTVAVVRGPLYRLAHVGGMSRVLPQQSLIHQVGALVSAGTTLTADDEVLLTRFLPVADWRAYYVCDWGGRLLFQSGFQAKSMVYDPLAPARLWVRLAARNPTALVRHWICGTRFVWWPTSNLYVGYLESGSTVLPNAWGIRSRPVVPWANRILSRGLVESLESGTLLHVLVWQPALPLYVTVGSLIFALARARSLVPLLIWAPSLCNTVGWLLLPFEPQLRFQFPVVILAPLLLGVATVDWKALRASPRA